MNYEVMAAKKRAVLLGEWGEASSVPYPPLSSLCLFLLSHPAVPRPFVTEEPGAHIIQPRRGVCNERFNCMLFLKGSFRKSVYVTEHFYCFQVFREPFTKPALDCFLWKRYDCEGLDPIQNRWLWKLFPFSVIFEVKIAIFYLKEMFITLAN